MIRSTFMGFEAAKSSIFSSQKSLDIVGHNLANSDTVGYTRQRVETASVYPSVSNLRVASSTVGVLGQGVDALGVAQIRDSFLDKRFREEYSNAAYHGKTGEILSAIQDALGDGSNITDESGLYGAMSTMFDSLNGFMQEPTSESHANLVMSSFENIIQVLHQLDSNLTAVATQYSEDLVIDIDRVNDITQQIAHLNDVISSDPTILINDPNEHYGPNELLDERNLLLDELASYGDIVVTDNSDGTVDVTMGGHAMVTGDKSDNLIIQLNEDYNTASLNWQSDGANFNASGGTILAALHFVNGSGNNLAIPNGEPYEGVVYYRNQIDTFANALADIANNSLPVLGTDGKPMTDPITGNIVYKQLLGAKDDDGDISLYGVSAENITLSKEWRDAGSTYFMYSESEHVEDYAQEIAYKLTSADYNFNTYGETFTGSLVDFEVNFLTNLASDVAFHNGRQESYATIADDFLNQRESVSNVSSDEETADMLKFQKSYEAAARIMTVMDELLDTIINNMGRVGL